MDPAVAWWSSHRRRFEKRVERERQEPNFDDESAIGNGFLTVEKKF
jgi:hypothetical protein